MIAGRVERVRVAWLTAAAVLWGIGAGVSIATLWIVEPHPGQLPGAMLSLGFDSRAPVRVLFSLIAGTFGGAWVFQPLIRRIVHDSSSRSWAIIATGSALASGLWLALADPYDPILVLFVPPAAAAACLLARRFDADFTPRDIILIPTGLTILAAVAAILPQLPFAIATAIAAALTLTVRLAVAAMRPAVASAYAFIAVPPALLLLDRFWIGEALLLRVLCLLIAVASPFVFARLLRTPPARALKYVSYPLFAIALVAAADPAGAEGMLRLNLFEDGHWLLPANEMAHGAVPFRDTAPGHGLISDGLLEFISIKLGAANAGQALLLRAAITALLPAAMYSVTLAATGSGEAAILEVIAGFLITFTGTDVWTPSNAFELTPAIRALPSIVALAICAHALRRRVRPARAFAAASAVVVIAFLTGVEFAVFSLVALIASWLLLPRAERRGAAIGAVAAGGALAVIVAVVLGAIGALPSLIRLFVRDYPRLSEAYAVPVFHWPKGYGWLLGFPEVGAGFFSPRIVWMLAWFAITAVTAIALALRRRPSRITDPALALGVWVIVSALSFAEREHVFGMTVVVAVVAAAIYHLRRWRSVFALAVVAAVVIVASTQRLRLTVTTLQSSHVRPKGFVEYTALPRARGVWIQQDNAMKIAAAQRFIERLPPGTTFFDFANQPALYYLFDRRCPVPEFGGAPFWEPREHQIDVIQRIESDPRVAAALVQFPNRGETSIDNVPNAVRTPLIAAYLAARFRPAYAQDGVVFWVRRR